MKFADYIAASDNYFWQPVEEEATTVFCIAMPGGGTIVYGKLLAKALGDLAVQGIPPFGALLLAFAATNHSTDDPLDKVETIIAAACANFDAGGSGAYSTALAEAMDFLRTLAAVPLRYTIGDLRLELFQAIFDQCHGQMSVKNSKNFLGHALEWVDIRGRFKHIPKKSLSQSLMMRDLKCLGLLGRRFPDVDSIVERLKPVPALPAPVMPEEEVKPVKTDFVDLLIEQHATFPVGALIRSIWSGLSVPIHHRLPGEQPLGGFADITTKGSFDKLLVSEFAHDELVLLTRLANNEALFFHREVPPGADDLQRVLLLDISLKSWGTPKILAYAVLLAIARHPRTDILCEAYAVGGDFWPINFNTVEEVIDSLRLVDAHLDPAKGMTAFFDKQPRGRKLEIIFLATAETLVNPAVLKVISERPAAFKYWVVVGRDGSIDVYKNHQNSRRLLQEMRLPLATLWGNGSGRQPKGDKAVEMAGVAEAPLLYPPAAQVKTWLAPSDGEIYFLDKTGKLFRRHRDTNLTKVRGWELLFKGIPGRMTHFEISTASTGDVELLCYSAATRELIIYRISNGGVLPLSLDNWKGASGSVALLFLGGCFYFESGGELWQVVGGQVTRVESPGSKTRQEAYHRKALRLQQAPQAGKFNRTVLRQLKRVAVNAAGNLLFNRHELSCDDRGNLVILQPKNSEAHKVVITAEWEKAEEAFIFPGGSKVSIDSTGMIRLEWPEDAKGMFDVVLWDRGSNPISVIKILRELLRIDLADCKRRVDSIPSFAMQWVTLEKATWMADQLKAAGAKAAIVPHRRTVYITSVLDGAVAAATDIEYAGDDFYRHLNRPMVITDPSSFFEKNIASFVRNNRSYATQR